MITTNVIQRTFFVQFHSSRGTAFALDVEGKQYLVTARHVIDGAKTKETVRILHDRTWKNAQITVVGVGETGNIGLDVAVLAAKVRLAPAYSLEANSGGVVIGQQVYFCGFPYGLYTETDINNGYPMPMVKNDQSQPGWL